MTQQVRPTDPRLCWQGAISFEDSTDWRMPWRIPYEQLSLFPPDALRERAAMPAGVRISFRTDTDFIIGHIDPITDSEEDCSSIDLYCNGEYRGSVQLSGSSPSDSTGFPPEISLLRSGCLSTGSFASVVSASPTTRPSPPTMTPVLSGSHTAAPSRTAELPRVQVSLGLRLQHGSTT